MRSLAIVILLVSTQASKAQTTVDPGLFGTLMEKVSVKTGVGTFLHRSDHGIQGSASVDISVARLTRGLFFGGDVSVFAGMGIGARYKIGDLTRPQNIKNYFAGISVPILDFAPITELPHPFVLHVSPFYQNALTRNYTTGNHNPVRGFGVSFSLTGFVTEYLGINVHVSRFEGRQPKGGFVWDTISESAGFGITLNLGHLLSDQRLIRKSLSEAREGLNERTIAFERLRSEHDSLVREQRGSRDSLLRAAVLLSEMFAAKTIERQSTLPVAFSSTESPALDEYDESRKAPIRIIKIDKQLFRGSDLVEEAYLKAILSLVTKHSDYVWEIAFRNSTEDGNPNGRLLADRIRQFFQIYDSRLDHRLTIVHDRSLRTEFEIRCLGLAKQDISDAY